MLNLLDGIEAIIKVSVDYYKVIAHVKTKIWVAEQDSRKQQISTGSSM